MVLNTVMGSSYGLIIRNMKGSSIRIKSKVEVRWFGLMGKSIRGIGGIIKCMEKGLLSGLMEGCMLGSMFKIKSMALVGWSGLMEKYMKGIGGREFKTVREK